MTVDLRQPYDAIPERAPRLDRVVVDEAAIQRRVSELGREISRHYHGRVPIAIGILNGAVIFMSDLVRAMSIPVDFEFMAVSSYGDATESSGVVRILKDLDTSIGGRDVLIVEDIVDSGLTLSYLRDLLISRHPAEVRIAALFRKDRADAHDVPIDWVGFEIPDEFVVGYGLDVAGYYRNLAFLAAVTVDSESASRD